MDIPPLVPERYAGYRPVVAEAFAFFLERLTPQRREQIYAEQTRLPSEAGLPRRFAAVIRCCPTQHKLGQIMARGRRLDPSLRIWLLRLYSGGRGQG